MNFWKFLALCEKMKWCSNYEDIYNGLQSVKSNVQSVGCCGIWHQVEWGSATEKILLENHALKVEKPMRVCQAIEQRQTRLCDTAVLTKSKIIWIVNKTETTTKGGNMEDSRRCGRKHILSVVQTLDGAEERNKQTNLQKKTNYLQEYLMDISLAGIQTGTKL